MKTTIAFAFLVILGSAGCGQDQGTDRTSGAAAAVQLSGAAMPGGWGFNPACYFPGSNNDPNWFSAASVGGTLTVKGAAIAQNNGVWTIVSYLAPGVATTGVNPGNVYVTGTNGRCVSETFPATATVAYAAP